MPYRQRGITIVEIMVALAMAAILLGVGVPAFNGLVAQRAFVSQSNDFLLAVQYARSEAATRGETVSVRAMDPSDDDNEWGPGWCVVVGTTNACDASDANTLRIFAGTMPNTLDAREDLDGISVLPFNSRGMLTLTIGGNLELWNCSSTETERDPGRLLTLRPNGRITIANVNCHS